ncbi:sulfite exporter TauE/SafE family protein [Rhodobium gokarnense]|uniref:Probable membrane transporter protein n=1 Tax=Rhodobium gokarnense TaxID=364296 RepID=A0ABT3HIG1_9HYPH|nr:sulfite exporter TauE/SafE family protein [Rhodobium gokarnense]MCW2310124.1 putative membrane protein YfcA [Rhodobium gokarnense]
MSPEQLAIVAAGLFFAAFVKGATGLGFSTSALPVLALAIGLKAAMPLVIVPSLISNSLVMIEAGHFRTTLSRFRWLYLASLPGLVLGLYLLDRVDGVAAGAVLGVVLALYGAFALASPELVVPRRLEAPLAPPTGFLAGFFNGLTGSQLMPILPYLMALRLEPDRFIQAINISFCLSSAVMAVGLAKIGLMTWHTLAISIAGLVPVFAGIKAGTALRRRLSVDAFRRLVLVVLIVLGAALVVRPVLG